MAANGGEGLRERRRRELTAEIREIAHRHLVEHGPAGLSLRAVARDAGIAVSALYRYFAHRDDLLTDLLVRAFDAHADAVEAATARASTPAAALAAGFRAYRAWAVEHPAEFGLAYGTPVPGYAAPGERTIRAATRIGDLLNGLLASAWEDGTVDRTVIEARGGRLGPATARQLKQLRERRGYGGPAALTATAMDAFVTLHGFVVMEVFGQLRPVTPTAAPYFEEILADQLDRLGLGRQPTGTTAGRRRSAVDSP
jgi:AcrR family transcriptional regulator